MKFKKCDKTSDPMQFCLQNRMLFNIKYGLLYSWHWVVQSVDNAIQWINHYHSGLVTVLALSKLTSAVSVEYMHLVNNPGLLITLNKVLGSGWKEELF